MQTRNIAFFEGFRYLIKDKPLLGAYVSMENLARGFLRHGREGEDHTYFDNSFFAGLTEEEKSLLRECPPRLKWKAFRSLLIEPRAEYVAVNCDAIQPDRQLLFRRLLPNKKTPFVRTTYTVATNAHLREILDICLLERGGRPWDALVLHSEPTRAAVSLFLSDLAEKTGGAVQYKGQLRVIWPGVDPDRLAPQPRIEARREWNLPEAAVILISNARLSTVSKMSYRRLIEYFTRLVDHLPNHDLFLVLAGSDQSGEAARLAAQVEGLPIGRRIRFLTDYPDSRKAQILSAGDIFIAPSDKLQESFGISLVEAMACGLPVICTDWNGHKDIVHDGVTGFRLPTRWRVCTDHLTAIQGFRSPYDHSLIHALSQDLEIDSDAFLDAGRKLVEDVELRLKMGAAGRRRVMDSFTIAHQVRAYEALWEELAEAAASDGASYPDLGEMLAFDYPRHFSSYPTEIIEAE